MAMYVSRWDAGRNMEEKGGEGRGGKRRAREVKNIESERVSEQTIVSFGVSYLLLLLITDSKQSWSSKEKKTYHQKKHT